MMCTARPSWKSMTIADMTYKKYMRNINVQLNGIISINGDARVRDRNYYVHHARLWVTNENNGEIRFR